MTSYFNVGSRFLIVRDIFASGDSANNLIFRPHIDTLSQTDLAVVDCVEQHVTHLSVDPSAPTDGLSFRFMQPSGAIWNNQWPTWVDTDSRDDHISMRLCVQLDGADPDDRPYVHAGYVIGRLEWMLREPDLTQEQIDKITYQRNEINTALYNAGLWGKQEIIDPPPPPIAIPDPVEPDPDPETEVPPAEEPTP